MDIYKTVHTNWNAKIEENGIIAIFELHKIELATKYISLEYLEKMIELHQFLRTDSVMLIKGKKWLNLSLLPIAQYHPQHRTKQVINKTNISKYKDIVDRMR